MQLTSIYNIKYQKHTSRAQVAHSWDVAKSDYSRDVDTEKDQEFAPWEAKSTKEKSL